MKRLPLVLAISVALLGLAWSASAQEGEVPGKRWEGRFFVNLNAGLQTASPTFGYGSTAILFDETATAALDIPGKQAFTFDAGGGVRLVQNFGVGATYSRYRADRTAELNASIPSPLMYSDYADVQRTIPLQRTEDVVHIQAVYRIPVTPRVQVGVSGGPSYFTCRDQLVSQFALQGDFAPDFDWLVDVIDISQTTKKESLWGFNAGADVIYLFSTHFGAGVNVRYSHASHQVANDFSDTSDLFMEGVWGGTGTGQLEEMKHGGLQFLGGISIRF